MSEAPDHRERLHLTPELAARTRFYAEADQSMIGTIDCGVLFIMAFWSGPARLAFAALKKVLADLDPHGRLELVVVDTDGCPEIYHLPEFQGQLAGAGETAWIKGGQIVSTALRPTTEALKLNTADLLAKCGA